MFEMAIKYVIEGVETMRCTQIGVTDIHISDRLENHDNKKMQCDNSGRLFTYHSFLYMLKSVLHVVNY